MNQVFRMVFHLFGWRVTCQLHPINQLATVFSWWCQIQNQRYQLWEWIETSSHWVPPGSVQQRWSNLLSLLLCSLLCLRWIWSAEVRRERHRYHVYIEYIQNILEQIKIHSLYKEDIIVYINKSLHQYEQIRLSGFTKMNHFQPVLMV